jgi:hypothetical protein
MTFFVTIVFTWKDSGSYALEKKKKNPVRFVLLLHMPVYFGGYILLFAIARTLAWFYACRWIFFFRVQGHHYWNLVPKTFLHSAKALPSATLGKEHTVKFASAKAFCRVFFIGHSAKTLPSAEKTLGKDWALGKVANRKNPKKKQEIFFNRRRTPPASAHRSLQTRIFRGIFSASHG